MLPFDEPEEESYRTAAIQCIATGDEIALERAYEIGKRHFESGHGISELVRLHHDALDYLITSRPDERAELMDSGKRVLVELLSHLDGELRRLRDYQTEQRYLNDQLRRQAKALDQTNEALRLAMAKVEDASRTKANFLANMSHKILTERNGPPNDPQQSEVSANSGLRCGVLYVLFAPPTVLGQPPAEARRFLPPRPRVSLASALNGSGQTPDLLRCHGVRDSVL